MSISDEQWEKIRAKWASKSEQEDLTKAEFKKDLKRGHTGEHSFFQLFQASVTHLDGRNADFEINKTGETIEIKTDYYDHSLTENFFMERYSYDDKPGGPWQSSSKKIDYYIYYYPSHSELYIFNTEQLVRRLDRIMKNEKLVNVKNKGYTTRGYKVKRSLIEDLCLNFEDIGLVESKGKDDSKTKRSYKPST